MTTNEVILCKYLVIGGGIAGVSCVEKLCENSPNDPVVLVSMSSVVKRVTNLQHLTKVLTSFDVVEEEATKMESSNRNLKILTYSCIVDIDPDTKNAFTDSGVRIKYEKACLCLGARPNMPFSKIANPESLEHILTIRDVESVTAFQSKLSSAKRIAVIGNGGIAAEVVYSLKNVDVLWSIKDRHLISVFCDQVSAEFFLNVLNSSIQDNEVLEENKCTKRVKYSVDAKGHHHKHQGAALGPDWHTKISVEGKNHSGKTVHIEKSTQIQKIFSSKPDGKTEESGFGSHGSGNDWNVYLEFNNGKIYGVDFIVSATGVIPNGDQLCGIGLEFSNGAIVVDENMKTNLRDIYAAGDVCHPNWENASPEWFQMRLWTQARQMGAFAGIQMASKGTGHLDFCFELFSHVTTFFGYKVVLLGLYNAQQLNESEYQVELRITEGKEFVKIIKSNGRLKGAILIGETELEETFENLILNQLYIEDIDLLDPIVDIDDYFD